MPRGILWAAAVLAWGFAAPALVFAAMTPTELDAFKEVYASLNGPSLSMPWFGYNIPGSDPCTGMAWSSVTCNSGVLT